MTHFPPPGGGNRWSNNPTGALRVAVINGERHMPWDNGRLPGRIGRAPASTAQLFKC